MKHIKILGLAAMAVMAMIAFVGASSASATVSCKTTPTGTNPTSCPSGWTWPAGTTIHAVNVGTLSMHSSFKTEECKKSTIGGKIENAGGSVETIRGPIEVLTFEECNCEVKVLKIGTFEIHALAEHSGTLTANGQEITKTCSTIFGNVHCIYVANNKDLGDITTGAPAVLHADVTIERKPTNGLCNEEATWTATYEVTSPAPLYFADTDI